MGNNKAETMILVDFVQKADIKGLGLPVIHMSGTQNVFQMGQSYFIHFVCVNSPLF